MTFSISLFIRAWKEVSSFQSLELEARSIVFYAEDAASAVHYESILKELTGGLGHEVLYLTSSPDDPILSTKNDKIRTFYIGNGAARTYLFANLKAHVLVMTMPDLETFHIKRSRVYPVHYIYVFHSIVSTHLIYRKSAFDHFDTLLCVGPHHVEEIRAAEAAYGLRKKNLIAHGYGRLDSLIKEHAARNQQVPVEVNNKKVILVAPSWGPNGLLETRGLDIVAILLEAGYHVVVRPHPVTIRKYPKAVEALKHKFGQNRDFVLETDIRSQESLHSSHCMISDWSGVALEYAFTSERPVIFVDVPKKINNPDYEDIPCEPLEVAIRTKIGEVVPLDQLNKIPDKIELVCGGLDNFRERIRQIRSLTVFNLGRSGVVAAECIAQIAKKCENRNNS